MLPMASAEDHTVLVSQSPDGMSYYFEPIVLEIAVGDNVTFVWGNGSHNVAQVASSDSGVYESVSVRGPLKLEAIGHFLQIMPLRMELCIMFVNLI